MPLENRYKRGRWECHDFYDTDIVITKTSKNGAGMASPLAVRRRPLSESKWTEFVFQKPHQQSKVVVFGLDSPLDNDKNAPVEKAGGEPPQACVE